jgi:hypothetical protein
MPNSKLLSDFKGDFKGVYALHSADKVPWLLIRSKTQTLEVEEFGSLVLEGWESYFVPHKCSAGLPVFQDFLLFS